MQAVTDRQRIEALERDMTQALIFMQRMNDTLGAILAMDRQALALEIRMEALQRMMGEVDANAQTVRRTLNG